MNEKLVLKLVEPYVVNNEISRNNFDNIFSILPKYEQGEIIKFLASKNILIKGKEDNKDYSKFDINEVLTALEEEENEEDKDEKEEEEKKRLKEKAFRESSSFEIIPRRDVKQSNEILCRLIQNGNKQAESDLCIKNHGLVCKYALKFLPYLGNDLSVDDLIQYGYLGLLRASKSFDYTSGYAFSTYAVHWIIQSINRNILDFGFRIRIPVHRVEEINKMCRIERKLIDMGYTHEKLFRQLAIEMTTSIDNIMYLKSLREQVMITASLDVPVGEDGNTPLMNFVEDTEAESVEDICLRHDCTRIINKILKTLTEREAKVIRLRFGLEDNRARTLEEVGQTFGVTRERIRQIEAKSLRKLRHPSRSNLIKDYVVD